MADEKMKNVIVGGIITGIFGVITTLIVVFQPVLLKSFKVDQTPTVKNTQVGTVNIPDTIRVKVEQIPPTTKSVSPTTTVTSIPPSTNPMGNVSVQQNVKVVVDGKTQSVSTETQTTAGTQKTTTTTTKTETISADKVVWKMYDNTLGKEVSWDGGTPKGPVYASSTCPQWKWENQKWISIRPATADDCIYSNPPPQPFDKVKDRAEDVFDELDKETGK